MKPKMSPEEGLELLAKLKGLLEEVEKEVDNPEAMREMFEKVEETREALKKKAN